MFPPDFDPPRPHTFEARFWLDPDLIVEELQAWSGELDPVTLTQRGVADWVEEDLHERADQAWLAAQFEVAPDKCWQVICRGTICSYRSGDEWDDRVTIETFQKVVVPDSYWYARFVSPGLETAELETPPPTPD